MYSSYNYLHQGVNVSNFTQKLRIWIKFSGKKKKTAALAEVCNLSKIKTTKTQ